MKAVISLLASSILFSNSKTIDESDTGALLTFPSVIDGELYNKSWDVAPAQFGYQKYGGTLEGVLVLPMNTTFHLECNGGEPYDMNPYIHYVRDFFVEEDDVSDFIMVIDRLDCYFVDKVQVAQDLGASAVIICDKKQESLFTMWMPQDWEDDLTIPSVLLQEENCELLYKHLGVQNWDDYNIGGTIYPDEYNINWTIATIEWGLPHDDDRVEWELWTSSNDLLGSEFKHHFNDTAIMLDKANDTYFTPHMYILNGSHWGCDDPVSLPCRKQCTNGGMYCAVDPEYDLTIGLDGMDVIQENLRSLCVWQYDTEHGLSSHLIDDDVLWWDYVVLWDEHCGILSNNTDTFTADCAWEQMDKIEPDLAQYVKDCIINSGGYGYHNGTNSILETETRLREQNSIYALPMVRVNEFLIHGNIDCDPPVTRQTCAVLAAICAGFINGTQPDVCYLTPAPTEAVCVDSERDCNGTCFGSFLTDSCDQCLLVTSNKWNNCIGCNGQPDDSTYDCEGVCGGNYKSNTCGYCIDSSRSDFETYGKACDDSCDSNMGTDECGVCQLMSSIDWNSCLGCDNVPNSGKTFNPCGYCVLSDASDWEDYGKDCAGNCTTTIKKTHYVDDCGNCLLTKDPSWNDCLSAYTQEPTNTEVEHLRKKEDELTTVIVVVCIVAFLIIVAACIIIGALWKKQGQIDERFNSLAATYQVMDENPQHSVLVSGSKQKTNKSGLQTVPDQEESGEDE